MRDFGNRGYGMSPPVNVGDELDVKIEAVGEKGDGVAKKDGFVLFVPGVKEGENVRIKVTRVLRKVGFAEVIGKSEGPIEDDSSSQEDTVEEAEPDYSAENDSEDFGEDSEDSSEEKTSEEESETVSDSEESEDFAEEPSEEDSEEDDDDKKKE